MHVCSLVRIYAPREHDPQQLAEIGAVDALQYDGVVERLAFFGHTLRHPEHVPEDLRVVLEVPAVDLEDRILDL